MCDLLVATRNQWVNLNIFGGLGFQELLALSLFKPIFNFYYHVLWF